MTEENVENETHAGETNAPEAQENEAKNADSVAAENKEPENKDAEEKEKSGESGDTEEDPRESQLKRFKIVEEYARELLQEFRKSLKAVVVYGSTAKKKHKKTSDIDTFVILDDTKIEEDIPYEVKDKIQRDLQRIAARIDKNITIQAFMFLTEFWEAVRNVNPVVIEILRSGIPVYDVGVFLPAKRMLQRGKIPMTHEAVEQRLYVAPQHLEMANYRLRSVAHYLEQAMASAGQAPLMFIGRMPPGKENVPKELEEHFVSRGLLEPEYAKMAQEIHDFAKEVEHYKDDKPIEGLGARVDEYIEKTHKFIERMKRLVEEMGGTRKSTMLVEMYKTFLKADVMALELIGVEPPEKLKDLPVVMGEKFPDLKEKHDDLFERLTNVIVMAKSGKAEMIPEQEIYKLRQEAKEFILELGRKLGEMKEQGLLKIEAPEERLEELRKHGYSIEGEKKEGDEEKAEEVMKKLKEKEGGA